MTWFPDACTLPTIKRPLRVAEFDSLFSSVTAVEREGTTVTLRLSGSALLDRARDLAARETECCSFFEFTVDADGDAVVMAIAVQPDYMAVLDGLEARARAHLR